MDVNIDALAGLAHVDLAPERREKLQEDIASILSYVEVLQRLNVPELNDTRTTLSAGDLRSDEVTACSDEERKGVVGNFPRVSDDGLLEAHAAIHRV